MSKSMLALAEKLIKVAKTPEAKARVIDFLSGKSVPGDMRTEHQHTMAFMAKVDNLDPSLSPDTALDAALSQLGSPLDIAGKANTRREKDSSAPSTGGSSFKT